MKLAVQLRDGQMLYRCPYHGQMWGMAIKTPQHSECTYCWVMYFLKLEAVTPVGKKEELMYNLNRDMTEVNKLEQRGNLDLEIYRNPKVTVELDPADADFLRAKS